MADATGLPVDVVGVPEGAALGAAYMARMAAGLETSLDGAAALGQRRPAGRARRALGRRRPTNATRASARSARRAEPAAAVGRVAPARSAMLGAEVAR